MFIGRLSIGFAELRLLMFDIVRPRRGRKLLSSSIFYKHRTPPGSASSSKSDIAILSLDAGGITC